MRDTGSRARGIATLVLVYMVLGGAFTDAGPILQFLGGQAGAPGISQQSSALPGPLFAALLLTSLLPHVSHLNFIDDAAKHLFQRLGNIPHEVRVLSDQLERTRLALPQSWQAHLMLRLQELNIDPGWLARAENSLTYKWSRVGLLYATARRWERSPIFSDYAKQRERTFADIFRSVEELATRIGRNKHGIGDDEFSPGTDSFRRINRKLDEVHGQLCDLIAGGLLQTGRSPKQRQVLLDELGFVVAEKQLRSAMSIHHIFLIGGAIFLVMLFVALIFQQFLRPGSMELNMRALFMVPVIYCVAIVIAIFPKSTWPFADIRVVGHRPVMGYAASGALAAAAAFLIQLLFRFVQGGNLITVLSQPGRFSAAFQTNLERWPWFFMTFFTTVVIAWAADNYSSAQEEPKWLRAAETVGIGFVFGVLQAITLKFFELLPHAARWEGKQVQMIATSALVGACIGFFVPSCYRSGCRRELEAGTLPHPAARAEVPT